MKRVNLITIESQGGLGNQLFQLGLAVELKLFNSTPVRIDNWRHDLKNARPIEAPYELFEIPTFKSNHKLMCKHGLIGKTLRYSRYRLDPRVKRESTLSFDETFLSVDNKSIYVGYFQSWKYFQRSFLTIKERLTEQLERSEWIINIKRELETRGPWYAIHVRRGDYLTKRSRSVHGVLDRNYYDMALRNMSSLLPNSRPVLFSDDPISAMKMLDVAHKNIEIFDPKLNGSNLENLLLMSTAKGIITANSSYSWWAAKLNDNRLRPVIVPISWYAKLILPFDDLIPKNWLKI